MNSQYRTNAELAAELESLKRRMAQAHPAPAARPAPKVSGNWGRRNERHARAAKTRGTGSKENN